MKKLFLMLAFLGSVVTTAFAENKPKPTEYYVVLYRGWCGEANIQKVYDHEPTWWDTFLCSSAADRACNMMYFGMN